MSTSQSTFLPPEVWQHWKNLVRNHPDDFPEQWEENGGVSLLIRYYDREKWKSQAEELYPEFTGHTYHEHREHVKANLEPEEMEDDVDLSTIFYLVEAKLLSTLIYECGSGPCFSYLMGKMIQMGLTPF